MLHSRLMSSQEDKAFAETMPGRRKVILATNIAESSLTFSDVRFGELFTFFVFTYPSD